MENGGVKKKFLNNNSRKTVELLQQQSFSWKEREKKSSWRECVREEEEERFESTLNLWEHGGVSVWKKKKKKDFNLRGSIWVRFKGFNLRARWILGFLVSIWGFQVGFQFEDSKGSKSVDREHVVSYFYFFYLFIIYYYYLF
jgi:hypothetical protein